MAPGIYKYFLGMLGVGILILHNYFLAISRLSLNYFHKNLITSSHIGGIT